MSKKESKKELALKNADFSDMRFEEGLKRLEYTLETLENGELALEESIQKYEEGMKLYNFCREKLDCLEKKVEILTRNASTGENEARPYKRDEIENDQEKAEDHVEKKR